MSKIVYYLGIDWGRALCGIAIADSETMVASTYGEISIKDFFDNLEKISKEINLETIVVGVTDSGDGRFNSNQKSISKFAQILKEKGYKVEFEEEFFTTQLAQKNLAEVKKKKITKNDNAESARLILQSWLDRN